MIVNFAEIQPIDIEGNIIEDFYLILGNIIYNNTEKYLNTSIDIYKGNSVELNTEQLTELKGVFNSSDLIPYYKKLVSDFIDTKLL